MSIVVCGLNVGDNSKAAIYRMLGIDNYKHRPDIVSGVTSDNITTSVMGSAVCGQDRSNICICGSRCPSDYTLSIIDIYTVKTTDSYLTTPPGKNAYEYIQKLCKNRLIALVNKYDDEQTRLKIERMELEIEETKAELASINDRINTLLSHQNHTRD